MNFLGNQTFCGSRTETKTYEQIHIVFNRRHAWHGAHHFLPTAGNDWDNDGTGSDCSVTDPGTAYAAQVRKKKSAEDRGFGK